MKKHSSYHYRLSLLQEIENEFSKDKFISTSKNGNKQFFTRKRFFNLRSIIVFIMLLKTSYQREINSFARKIAGGDYNIREVTAGALTQARAKLNPWAFQRLNQVALDSFYKNAPCLNWKSHRLLGVDGSVLNLPYSKSIIKEFGSEDYIQNAGPKKSLARCSLVYDVLNNLTIDGQIGKYKESEKTLFERSLDKLEQGDIILGDRGYGHIIILHWLKERNIDFCIRLKKGHRNIVKKFMLSDQKESLVELPYSKALKQELGLKDEIKSIMVRLVKVVLDSGSIEVLCTSLIDKTKYPIEEFKELYFKRWKVEEAYKLLKARVNVEAFSGRTSLSIYQDFYAKIFMMTLCSTLTFPIDQKVKDEYNAEKTGNKYDQQINKVDALAETRSNLIHLLIKKLHQTSIDCMDLIIESSRDIVRPNRKMRRCPSNSKRGKAYYKQL